MLKRYRRDDVLRLGSTLRPRPWGSRLPLTRATGSCSFSSATSKSASVATDTVSVAPFPSVRPLGVRPLGVSRASRALSTRDAADATIYSKLGETAADAGSRGEIMGNTAAASAVIAKCVRADCMSACLCPCSDAVSDLCGRCRYPKISAIIQ
eukprot:COSAG01_NODE_13932_length_1516_cov_5.454481_4_plen_152_part_01